MSRIYGALLMALCWAFTGCAPVPADGEKGNTGSGSQGPVSGDGRNWEPLFNGKDLNGWTVKLRGLPAGKDPSGIFSVRDGRITVSYPPDTPFAEKFGHLFFNTPFSHYLLGVEYRFIGEQATGGPDWALRNSGIMVHSQSPASMGIDQDFPISIEVQLLGGDSTGERPTANLCTPGTHVVMDGKLFTPHCVNSASPTFRGDQWVRVEVLVLGDSAIRHIVNGDTVLRYEKPQMGGGVVSGHDPALLREGELLRGGYIALQSESHPVEFRKVEMIRLDGQAP